MRYVITENQYKVLLTEDRVDYLRNQSVISPEQIEKFQKNIIDKRNISDIPNGDIDPKELKDKPNIPKIMAIEGDGGVDIAYIVEKKGKKQVKLTEPTFQIFVDSDPSKNKQYVQWIIDVFKKHALHNTEEAQRFVVEDMDQATDALEQFDCVKESKKFRLNAKDRPGAPSNPKDIRQYDSISQLYTVVSGFICGEDDDDGEGGDTGGLSKKGHKLFTDIMGYVKLGQAKVHKLSDKVIIYQPQTLQSSCEPLGSLASWCTRATPSGGVENETGDEWFHRYRGARGDTSRQRPSGEVSDYYVVMPIELFKLEVPSSHPYYPLQLHFESGQLHKKDNSSIGDDGIRKLVKDFPEVGEYLRKELGFWSQESVKQGAGLMDSKYITYLNKFGGKAEEYINDDVYKQGVNNIKKMASEQNVPLQQNKYLKWLMENTEGINIVDFLDPTNTDKLDFSGLSLGELPDLSKFTKLDTLLANNCGLKKLPPVEFLPKMAPLSLIGVQNNEITEAPPLGYSQLPNLFAITLKENPIKKINVEELAKINKDGTFIRFAIDKSIVDGLDNKEEFEAFMEGTTFDGIGAPIMYFM
jgi:hypothetical protein